jgi:hypothetical protein
MSNNNSTAAKDGGANQSKTIMPPVSQEYRDNWSEIFGLTPLEKRLKQEQIDSALAPIQKSE